MDGKKAAAVRNEVQGLCRRAREAARLLAGASTSPKNQALAVWAEALAAQKERLQAENAGDCAAGRRAGLSAALLDRLLLTDSRLDQMAAGLRAVAKLPDPVGTVLREYARPDGLVIRKVRVPLGVVLIIYESRPNVTVDAAALTLKAGNAVILRGGKEARRTNLALGELMRQGLQAAGLPPAAVQVVASPGRAVVGELLRMDRYIDVVIPRGGETLIRRVVAESTIPVIKHYKGLCTVYVDEFADLEMAQAIVINAKCQRPGVCNAAETLLVHQAVAPRFLPQLSRELLARKVELRGCPQTVKLVPEAQPAGEADWDTEFLDLILAVKVVRDMDEALAHLEAHSSRHTEAIVSRDPERRRRFAEEVDSGCVFLNASTRFSDGFEFGLGAEIGISTDKLHARGPMGLEELCSYKYIGEGQGNLRS